MKATKYEGHIDITKWDFPDEGKPAQKQYEKIDKLIHKLENELESLKSIYVDSSIQGINRTITHTFKEQGVIAEICNGTDQISFGIPLGPYQDDYIWYKASLKNLINSLIIEVLDADCDEAMESAKATCKDMQLAVAQLVLFLRRHEKKDA